MGSYLIRRLIYMVILLLVLSIFVFIIIQLPPGDYLSFLIESMRESGVLMEVEQMRALEQHYGLDLPVYLQKWHIDYNSDAEKIAKEEGFETWQEAFNNHFWWIPVKDLSKPTMQPWVLTKSTTAIKVHERNPYYWKVDTEGQQLPYIDQIVTGIVDIETYHTKIISGEADMAFAKTQFVNFTLYKENEEAGGYTVHSLPGVRVDVGYIVNLTNLDPIKGPILGDVRFRQALSLATDADEVNKVIFSGLGTPRQ